MRYVFLGLRNAVVFLFLVLLLWAIAAFVNPDARKSLDNKGLGAAFVGICTSTAFLLGALTYFFNRESHEKAQVDKYITYLNNHISDATLGSKKGVEAYLEFTFDTEVRNVIMGNLNLVLFSYETYLSLIDKNALISKEFKEISTTNLHLLFYTKVLWPFHKTITDHGEKRMKTVGDDYTITIPKFAKLSLNCIYYLKNKGLAQDSVFKDENIQKLKRLLPEEVSRK